MNKYMMEEQQLMTLLELQRNPVGIRFLKTKDEFENVDAQPIIHKLPYCVMVRSASYGHSIKAVDENFGCRSAARALGFVEAKEDFLSGKDGYAFGIYDSLEIAKDASQTITLCHRKTYGVKIASLSLFQEEPDVIIIFVNPYHAMRLLQAHTFFYGSDNCLKARGLQAICSESTAYPYMTGNMNVSMLCSGTRYVSRWGEDELAVSFPYDKLNKIIEGLIATINPLERDKKKKRIEEEAKKNGLQLPEIIYGKNYDTGLYQFGKSGRR